MANTLEMRQKRFALIAEARGILNKAEAEKREVTGDELAQYNARMDDSDKMLAVIEREERLSAAEIEMGKGINAPEKPEGVEDRGEQPAVIATEGYAKAFRSWMRGGLAGCSDSERSVLAQAERRDNVVGTNSLGGFTVPQGFSFNLGEAMKAFGGARAVGAEVIRTAAGNVIPWPSNDDTANVGAIVAEGAAATAQDLAFTSVNINAYMYESKTILVSYEMLADSAFDIPGLVQNRAATRIGRITNTHFTVGTGTGQPQGMVTAASTGKTGTTGQTTSVIYDDLVDLEHSVDPAYRAQGARWMFHDQTLKVIKKLKDTQGRPLWLPGIAVREPDTILSYPYTINQDMPVMAANAKSILFGNFFDYKIRDVMDVTLYRIVDKYIENRKVGFIAYSRHDGRSIATGGSPFKAYANSAI